ncbi:hypothetical protein SLP22_0070 [Salmonella phage BAU.Micro_SLP-22]
MGGFAPSPFGNLNLCDTRGMCQQHSTNILSNTIHPAAPLTRSTPSHLHPTPGGRQSPARRGLQRRSPPPGRRNVHEKPT